MPTVEPRPAHEILPGDSLIWPDGVTRVWEPGHLLPVWPGAMIPVVAATFDDALQSLIAAGITFEFLSQQPPPS